MGEHELTSLRRRAVFLDRDGVLNRAVVRDGKPYPPSSWEEFELLPGVLEACARLKDAGFLLVVVTNQPDVGRGHQSREVVEGIHRQLESLLPIDRVEVCYDPGGGRSARRKPAPGMILDAAGELGIDLSASYLVGDRWRDIDAGATAGCARTFFIDYGYEEPLRTEPDHKVRSLAEAADLILQLSNTIQ